MSARDQMRQKLDELMGTGRDGTKNPIHYSDPKVCRCFLLGLCPHDALAGTKMSLGACLKIHNYALKADFENSSRTYRSSQHRFYQLTVLTYLQKVVRSCEILDRAKKGRLTRCQSSSWNGGAAEKAKELKTYGETVDKKLVQAEELGSQGKVDEALALIREVEKLKRKRNRIEKYLFRKSSEPAKEQKQIICDECLLCIGLDDNEQRVANHSSGRLHNALLEMRRKIAGLAASLEKAQLPVEWAKIDFSQQQNRPSSNLDLASTRARSYSPRRRSRTRSRHSSRSWSSSSSSSRSRFSSSQSTVSSRRSSRSWSRSRSRHSSRRRGRSRSGSYERHRGRSRSKSTDDHSSRRRRSTSSRSWSTSVSREYTPRRRRSSRSRSRSRSRSSETADIIKPTDNPRGMSPSRSKSVNEARPTSLGTWRAVREEPTLISNTKQSLGNDSKTNPDLNLQCKELVVAEEKSKPTVKKEETQRQSLRDDSCPSGRLRVLAMEKSKLQSARSEKSTLAKDGGLSVQTKFNRPSKCPRIIIMTTKRNVKNEEIKQNSPSRGRCSGIIEDAMPLKGSTPAQNSKGEPRITTKHDTRLRLAIVLKPQCSSLKANVEQEHNQEPTNEGCDSRINNTISPIEKSRLDQSARDELCITNEHDVILNPNSSFKTDPNFHVDHEQAQNKIPCSGCHATAAASAVQVKKPKLLRKAKVGTFNTKENDANLCSRPHLKSASNVPVTTKQSVKAAPTKDVFLFETTSLEKNQVTLSRQKLVLNQVGNDEKCTLSGSVKVENNTLRGLPDSCSVTHVENQKGLNCERSVSSQSPLASKVKREPVGNVIYGPHVLTEGTKDVGQIKETANARATIKQTSKHAHRQTDYCNKKCSAEVAQDVSCEKMLTTVDDTKAEARVCHESRPERKQKTGDESKHSPSISLTGSSTNCQEQVAQSSSLKPSPNIKRESRSEKHQPRLGLLDASLKPTSSTTGKTRKPISSSPDNSRPKVAQTVKRVKFERSTSRDRSTEGSVSSQRKKEIVAKDARPKKKVKKRANLKRRPASKKPARSVKKAKDVEPLETSHSESMSECQSSEEIEARSNEQSVSVENKNKLKKVRRKPKSKAGARKRQRRAVRKHPSSVSEDTTSTSSGSTNISTKEAKKRTFKKKAKKAGTKALGSKSSTAKKQSARCRHSPRSRRRAVKKRKCPSPSPETSCSSSDEESTQVSSSSDGTKRTKHEHKVKSDVSRSSKRPKNKRS